MAAIPETIGRYTVVERIARGGMGVLYRAHDPSLQRDVALKMMHIDFTVDAHARERFQREARAIARLQHPNIVTIHELGEFEEAPFIVMELLGGQDLQQMLRLQTPLSMAERLDIVAQVCDGLAYAHDQGIVHRDIKPANVRVLDDGKVKILDFGIAKFASSSLTQSGAVMGTPSYMPPEQILGQRVDGRADLFSAGVLLYELLSGRKPFTGDSPTAVAYSIIHSEPPPLRETLTDLPEAVSDIVVRALQKDPNHRYATAREMASDLQRAKVMLDLPLGSRPTPAPVSGTETTTKMSSADLFVTDGRSSEEPARDAMADMPMRTSAAEARADRAPSARVTVPKRSMNPVVLVGGLAALLAIGALAVTFVMTRDAQSQPPDPGTGELATTGESVPGTTAEGVIPEPPPPRLYRVTSVPEGAAISLDGVATGLSTPAELELTPPMPSQIELSLDLHEPFSADISEADLDAGAKEYALVPAERPVRLTVSASYPFELVAGSRVISAAATSHDVTIQPGTRVAARNAAYLLNSRLSLDFRRSRQTITLNAPGSLRVFATNETCVVFADGRDLSFPPIPPMPVAAGSHTIVLRCGDGTESTQTVRVQSGEVATVRFGGESMGGIDR